ncbi:MAG TPA: amino acid adenylation domain-containing protein [Thermoanaerobaculia bacterium]|jgi:amino acid adenylation domain-containing protein|nr:amino acid adenylation domain-containing protein [Thermoanaerobaculia bacterium]
MNGDAKKRELLEALLRQRGVDTASLPILPRTGDPGVAPLSFAQERLWVLERFEPGRATYNEAYALRLAGALVPGALAGAVDELVRRHAVLRTTFAHGDSAAVQVIAPPPLRPLPVVDLAVLPEPARGAEADRLERAEAARPFDLERGPVARTLLLRLEPREHHLLLAFHHIVSDATSIQILVAELLEIYRAFDRGEPSPLPAPKLQYADFSHWQRERQTAAIERQLEFWKRQLQAAPTVLELPADRPRSESPRGRGATLSAALPELLSRRVRALAQAEGATLFMTLLAAFDVLLYRYTGRTDLLVGTPIAGRTRPEVERMVGFFVNTLALRADLGGDPSFREVLARHRRTVSAAFDNQDVPFGRLVEELRPERAANHAPLIQVMFLLQKSGLWLDDSPELRLELRRIDNGTAKFELTFLTRDAAEGIVCGVEYDRDLFTAATMVRFLEHYRMLLEDVVTDPGRRLSELELFTAPERHQLCHEWNDSALARPRGVCIHELFAAQAARTPDLPAVISAERVVSYRELLVDARRFARRLRALGVGTDDLVGLSLEPSPDLLVAVLGILEAGGAYVPLDPGQPAERLAWMLADTGVGIVVTESALADRLPPSAAAVVRMDAERQVLSMQSAEPLVPLATPESLAYQIYTSGSTGRPKGVMVPHGGLVNLALSFAENWRLRPGDRMLMLLSLAFDASVGDLFPPLVSGATLVLHRTPQALLGRDLEPYLERQGITCIELAAAFWQQWTDDLASRKQAPPSSLRALVVGGESVSIDKVRTWYRLLAGRRFRFLNHYGPTEGTVCASSFKIDEESEALGYARLPIGRSLANVRLYVLDPDLQPVPAGVPGELFIGGIGVARGYLGRPGITAERFIPDPFAGPEERGARLYRTGDLVRRLPDGNLDFLGRVDHQVKIRGYRIEPGEIEAALAEHPALRESAVLARADEPGPKRLVAYVVAGSEPPPAAAELRAFLQGKLPAHMVPEAFVFLDRLPLNASGKVDRKALPRPVFERGADEAAPPKSELQRRIAAIWRDLLRVERVGLHDNFFELGGHSLLLIQMEARLRDALGREVQVIDLFRHPTVAALAELLEGGKEAGGAEEAPATARREGRDIAIVGMAGRFPGADSVDELWRNVREGVESISFFSREELLAAGIPQELISDPSYVRAKGVLRDVDRFDAPFFGYSPREAEILDPQHRHFLECAWEALESAGYDPEAYSGAIGVFAGVGRNSYFVSNLLANEERLQAAGLAPAILGNEKDFVPTRVSYKLNLRGPSVLVQTACSTSLVAAHFACRSLLDDECDMALAGGVTIPVPHQGGYVYDEGGIFSPDGHCRAFDAAARGTVPGSGVAIVVLKRLADALADGDFIHAVLKASAINNDGSLKVGYTAPSPEGQARVIRDALRRAGVAAGSVSYVETHGTGTALGDVIEIEALKEVFRSQTPEAGFCALGSLKANVGHMDTAAGAGGLIKAAMALRHGEIPPSLHFRTANPKLGLDGSPFFVNDRLRPWPETGGPRRASVSSFGIGGTNAHAVLEEAPRPQPAGESRPWQVLTLSARTEGAVARAAERLASHLEGRPEIDLADAAYTLHVGRRAFDRRVAVVCRDRADAAAALRRIAGAVRTASADPEVVFLFPGSGAQHVHMGRDLYRSEAVFRETIDRAAGLLAPLLGHDLRRLLHPAEGEEAAAAALLERASIAMPAVFVLSHALANLWISWGVRPHAMAGHSLGEYVAACLAGVFSFEDALHLVSLRGRLLDGLPEGSTLSVPLSEAEIEPLLGSELSVAAVNTPEVTVVSGPAAAVRDLELALAARGVEARRIHIAAAMHSQLVEPILDEFRQAVEKVVLQPPQMPYVSTVTGTWITAAEATDPGYWAAHLRRTVRFADAVVELLRTPRRIVLEVGPGRTLASLVRQQVAPEQAARVFASQPHPSERRSDLAAALETLGALWCVGVRPDWQAFDAGERRRRVPLPTYPFEDLRYWIEPVREGGAPVRLAATLGPAAAAAQAPQPAAPRHPRPGLEEPYEAPHDGLELDLAAIWQDLLGIEPIGRCDGYFELGGDSLIAIRLLARVRQELSVDVSLETFLAHPTLAGLAAAAARRESGAAEAIPRASRDRPLPLSYVQEDTWRNLRRPDGVLQHNASAAYRGAGPLHREVLEMSLAEIARRHEILRTTFPEAEGQPVQRIAPAVELTVPLIDLSGLPEARREPEAQRIGAEAYWERFPLETGPFLRLMAVRFGERDHGLLRAIGRLVTDGGSLHVLLDELMAFYGGFLAGRRPELPEPPIQYADFAVWQRRSMESEAMRDHLAYWTERMRGVPDRLYLRTDFPYPASLSYRGTREGVPLSPLATEALKALARLEGATLFMVLLALYGVLLHRHSGQEDFVVATPMSHRVPETERVMGRFLNTLALRFDLAGDPSFRELLRRVRETCFEAYAHKDLPHERLVQEVCPAHAGSFRPLCQVSFVLQEIALPELRLGETVMHPFWVDHGGSDFELTLGFSQDESGGLDGFLEYTTDLFTAATTSAMAAQIQVLAAAVVENPRLRLSDLMRRTQGDPAPPDETVPMMSISPFSQQGDAYGRTHAGG